MKEGFVFLCLISVLNHSLKKKNREDWRVRGKLFVRVAMSKLNARQSQAIFSEI